MLFMVRLPITTRKTGRFACLALPCRTSTLRSGQSIHEGQGKIVTSYTMELTRLKVDKPVGYAVAALKAMHGPSSTTYFLDH